MLVVIPHLFENLLDFKQLLGIRSSQISVFSVSMLCVTKKFFISEDSVDTDAAMF